MYDEYHVTAWSPLSKTIMGSKGIIKKISQDLHVNRILELRDFQIVFAAG